MERIYRSVEPFDLPGHGEHADIGILMIHGFTGSPSELRRLGYYLNDLGFSVHALLLPGHGTTPDDMIRTGWADWWHHIRQSYDQISANYKTNIVIGFSMGGLLALKLAMERKVDGLVSISTPIYLQSKKSIFAVLLRYFITYIEKKKLVGPELIDEACSYRKTPLTCVVSLRKLIRLVKCSLQHVQVPLFIAQGQRDGTVQPRSASYIYEHVMSVNKSIRYYPASSHAILLDEERELVYEDVRNFIQSVVPNSVDARI